MNNRLFFKIVSYAPADILGAEAAEALQELGIVARSPKLLEALALIVRTARTPYKILITGETGVGKELVAKLVHRLSGRRTKPFVAFNCAAISEELAASQLFGHVRGAFTGAVANHPGYFQIADGGTLFLDEIGDLSPANQVKLLRVLQNGKVAPVGSEREITVDVRVVLATNVNLGAAIAEGRFRKDLFYRINVVRVEIPPLRERLEDIIPLAELILGRLGAQGGVTRRLSSQAVEALLLHKWEGNIRELDSRLTRAYFLAEGDEIQPRDLELGSLGAVLDKDVVKVHGRSISLVGKTLPELLDEVQKTMVLHALEECGWNGTKAAEQLGIKRTALVKLMGRLGIERGANVKFP